MDRRHGTFDAYDGVRLRLGTKTITVPAFTVTEAVRYLRMLDDVGAGDLGAHYRFLTSFTERARLGPVPLSDLGLERAGRVRCGPMPLADALRILETLGSSGGRSAWRAQASFLDDFGPYVDGDPTPAEVFEAGGVFAAQVYAVVYGLAQRFLRSLTLPPGGQAKTTTTGTPPRSGLMT